MSTVTANSAQISQHLKLDLFKRFTQPQWKKLGSMVAKWIREDLAKGILQGALYGGVDHYRSRQYMKHKRNQMKKGDGKRLKEYAGARITSTRTDKVDLTLTGAMKNSLRPINADRTGVNIGVDPVHAGKILGNRVYGREILTLNQKNQDKALDWMIENMIDPQLKEFARDTINISVKI